MHAPCSRECTHTHARAHIEIPLQSHARALLQSSDGKAVVRLGMLLPFSGWAAGKFILGAATLAINDVNADPSLMPDRHIEYAPLVRPSIGHFIGPRPLAPSFSPLCWPSLSAPSVGPLRWCPLLAPSWTFLHRSNSSILRRSVVADTSWKIPVATCKLV